MNPSFFIHKLNNPIISVFLFPFTGLFQPHIAFYTGAPILYHSRELGMYYFVNLVLIFLSTTITKKITNMQRPSLELMKGKIMFYRRAESNNSMPSGDVAQSAGLCSFLIFILPQYSAFWLMIVIFVSLGRVYFGCHYIQDTIVGALMGFAVSYINLMWIQNLVD